jgi:hypothetical protein
VVSGDSLVHALIPLPSTRPKSIGNVQANSPDDWHFSPAPGSGPRGPGPPPFTSCRPSGSGKFAPTDRRVLAIPGTIEAETKSRVGPNHANKARMTFLDGTRLRRFGQPCPCSAWRPSYRNRRCRNRLGRRVGRNLCAIETTHIANGLVAMRKELPMTSPTARAHVTALGSRRSCCVAKRLLHCEQKPPVSWFAGVRCLTHR